MTDDWMTGHKATRPEGLGGVPVRGLCGVAMVAPVAILTTVRTALAIRPFSARHTHSEQLAVLCKQKQQLWQWPQKPSVADHFSPYA